jgi:hypothetical protein
MKSTEGVAPVRLRLLLLVAIWEETLAVLESPTTSVVVTLVVTGVLAQVVMLGRYPTHFS